MPDSVQRSASCPEASRHFFESTDCLQLNWERHTKPAFRRSYHSILCIYCRHCCLDWFRWQLRQHEAFLSDVRRPRPVEGDPSSAPDEFALQCPVCRSSVDAGDIGRLRTLASDAEQQVRSDSRRDTNYFAERSMLD